MRAMGHRVEIVPASSQNIKVTTADDFAMVEAMIKTQKETRTAMGFDVHAFEKEHGERKLMLGGLEIPHDFALTGHSDADVVLHAITDALLGTLNQGDIGTHFPPDDPQWKNVDSAVFLKKTKGLLDDNSVDIKFIDVTIMTEAPKIGPYRAAMQTRIGAILDLDPKRISIKATTTEKLGFTGRQEGMACQALATVLLPQ
jgi:2-C-methyl-D-erythritol 4-phosphate cytidylyltransferase/2-C-methyl-D-erythritol 2,4-cyclodiphosphate synthase